MIGSNDTFDAMTRRASMGLSRRSSVLALGGSAVAAFAKPSPAPAAKAGKKCKKQGKQCRLIVIASCGANNQQCIDAQLPCCAHFGRCKAAAAFACLDDD